MNFCQFEKSAQAVLRFRMALIIVRLNAEHSNYYLKSMCIHYLIVHLILPFKFHSKGEINGYKAYQLHINDTNTTVLENIIFSLQNNISEKQDSHNHVSYITFIHCVGIFIHYDFKPDRSSAE